jgi:coproporphyrinogen III oxidase-like Fe-S oxidoreductase
VAKVYPDLNVACFESFYDEPPEAFTDHIGDGTHVEFQLEARPELLDEKFIARVSRLNKATVRCGMQSIHTSVLAAINRPKLNRDRVKQMYKFFYESNIQTGIDLICGLPNDTLDGFRDSINFAIGLRPRLLETFTLMILPGTKIDQRRDEWAS